MVVAPVKLRLIVYDLILILVNSEPDQEKGRKVANKYSPPRPETAILRSFGPDEYSSSKFIVR